MHSMPYHSASLLLGMLCIPRPNSTTAFSAVAWTNPDAWWNCFRAASSLLIADSQVGRAAPQAFRESVVNQRLMIQSSGRAALRSWTATSVTWK